MHGKYIFWTVACTAILITGCEWFEQNLLPPEREKQPESAPAVTLSGPGRQPARQPETAPAPDTRDEEIPEDTPLFADIATKKHSRTDETGDDTTGGDTAEPDDDHATGPMTTESSKPAPATEIAEDTAEKSLPKNNAELITGLQKQVRTLHAELIERRDRCERLERALQTSRQSCRELSEELNKHKILLQIARLKPGSRYTIAKTAEKHSTLPPAEKEESHEDGETAAAKGDAGQPRMDTLLKYTQLKREHKRLELRYRLLAMEEPEKTKTISEKWDTLNKKIETLSRERKKLSDQLQETSEIAETQKRLIARLKKERPARDTSRTSRGPAGPTTVKPGTISHDADTAIEETKLPAGQKIYTIGSQPPAKRNKDSVAAVPTNPPVASPAGSTTIKGTISRIQGKTITIDIGSDNDVRKGMRFIVYRNDKFVGYLHIIEVLKNESLGTLTRKIRSPERGDTVADKL